MALPDSEEDLLVRRREPFSAEKHNQLVALVTSARIADSPDLLIERNVLGTSISFLGSDGASSSPIWRVSASRVGSGYELTVGRGLVGGVEPKIGDRLMSALDARKRLSRLTVKRDDFDAQGLCRLYVELHFDPQWNIAAAQLLASATTRSTRPWLAYDLLGILQRLRSGAVSYHRFAFLNHGHIAVQRGSGGIARHLFWAQT